MRAPGLWGPVLRIQGLGWVLCVEPQGFRAGDLGVSRGLM